MLAFIHIARCVISTVSQKVTHRMLITRAHMRYVSDEMAKASVGFDGGRGKIIGM